jgi:predicted nucleic acid-binding protein
VTHPPDAAPVVVDASVAIQWVRTEAHSGWARGFLDPSKELLAPDLMPLECANVFWRLRRQGEPHMPEPEAMLGRLLQAPIAFTRADPRLVHAALRLAGRLGHPIYDCLYLALALDRDAALATADARFAAAIRRAGALPPDRLLTPPAAPA